MNSYTFTNHFQHNLTIRFTNKRIPNIIFQSLHKLLRKYYIKINKNSKTM